MGQGETSTGGRRETGRMVAGRIAAAIVGLAALCAANAALAYYEPSRLVSAWAVLSGLAYGGCVARWVTRAI